jgi:hypothetical protein
MNHNAINAKETKMTTDKLNFDDWLAEIDKLAIKAGAAEAGQSYVGWTGKDGWSDMYDNDMTPEEAWGEEEDAARSSLA